MTRIAADIARCLDPVQLAAGIGMVCDEWQASVLRSEHPRILLNAARQTGKSQIVAVLAVHVATYEPGSLILLLSPSLRQSQELFKKCLAVYRSLGRQVPSESENALSLSLESGSRIVSLPGTETTIRAYSAVRLLLIDEAARCDDAAIAACRPFLAVSGGSLVMLSTPHGRRGAFWEAWEHGGGAYERYRVPASECSRISAAFLAEERAALGSWMFAAEYECAFCELSGVQIFTEEQLRRAFDVRIQPLFPTTKGNS